MKLTAILLIFAFIQVHATAYAQRVTIRGENISLENVFRDIREQTGYSFIYAKEQMKQTSPVSLDVKNEQLDEVLKKCFDGQPLTYTLDGRIIIVRQREPSVQAHAAAVTDLTLSGEVTDSATGRPLVGVTIQIKGSNKGTTTDAKGRFSLQVPDNAVLVVSYIGYNKKEVPVNGRSAVHILLSSSATGLEQLVVIGYGTQKKTDLTGAISTVTVDSLGQGVTTSVDQLLQGKVAGVNIVQNDGKPGGGLSVNIRGASSINASNRPLYVIDGVPLSDEGNIGGLGLQGIKANPRSAPRSPLATINPMDIASISVLKGPSAVAIYGSRGANGVVLITTKQGQQGKIQVNYNGYVGIQNVSNHLKLLNADQYEEVLNALLDAGADDNEFRVTDVAAHTDWQKEVTQKNALVHNHELSFSGGSDHTNYYISLGYIDQRGIILNSGFKRYSARLNLNTRVSDKFDLGLRFTTAYTKNDYSSQGGGINENAGALYAAYNYDPTLPVKDSAGNYVTSPFVTIDNPVALANGVLSSSNGNRILGSVFGEYHITKHLFAKGTVAGNFNGERRKSFVTEITKAGKRNGGAGSFQNSQASDYLFRGELHYENAFNAMNEIKAFVGVSYQHFLVANQSLFSGNFPTTDLQADNLGLGDQTTYKIGTSKAGHRLASYIGRVNYMLNNKYLFTGSVRLDGSSRFGVNHRFATFPSFAFGWKLDQEAFLQNADFLSELKLRLGWGETGNEGIGNYQSIPTLEEGQLAIWDNNVVTTTTPSRLPNPDLKWETTREFNVGLDFGILKGRLSGSIDFYRKNTVDMLLDLPVPQSTGFNVMTTNIGSMVNSGFEFSLSSENIAGKNFTWTTDLNVSTLRNRVKSLGPLTNIKIGGGYFSTGDPAIDSVGEPLNSFYGYKIIGIWQQDDDFSKTKDNVQPGDFKFEDVNGDSTVNGADRVLLGNSFPKIMGSINNTFRYKGFGLFVSVTGVYGISMLNLNLVDTYYPINFRRNKFAEPYLNRWTPDNPSNKYPSFVSQFDQGSKPINNYVVEDASYLKLNTVRLSYTFPHFKKVLSSLTVYLLGENLVTLTGYQGIDPAINPQGNAAYRIDFNTYPTARTFIFGVRLGL